MNCTHFELATHLQIAVQFDDWAGAAKNLDWAKANGMQVGARVTDRGAKSTLHISVSTQNHSACQSIAGLSPSLARELRDEMVKRGAVCLEAS